MHRKQLRLAFLTACLPGLDLGEITKWAARTGFDALEIAAWPPVAGRDHTAAHLNVRDFSEWQAAAVRETLAEHAITASALGFYENNLHPDEEHRARIHEHLRACIDAAALLDITCVGTFVGMDTTRSVSDNLKLGAHVMPPLVEYAAERGVRLAIENCPMEGWHPDGYPANLAYSPQLWEEFVFPLGLYLNWDPSHLLWLGIDIVDALRPYIGHIIHVQAKDTQIDADARTRYGFYGRVRRPDPWDSGWWQYRVPGLGDIDWPRVIGALREGGYDGVVSIEHEDPVWSGSVERVKHGLTLARDTLRPLVSEAASSPDASSTDADNGNANR